MKVLSKGNLYHLDLANVRVLGGFSNLIFHSFHFYLFIHEKNLSANKIQTLLIHLHSKI